MGRHTAREEDDDNLTVEIVEIVEIVETDGTVDGEDPDDGDRLVDMDDLVAIVDMDHDSAPRLRFGRTTLVVAAVAALALVGLVTLVISVTAPTPEATAKSPVDRPPQGTGGAGHGQSYAATESLSPTPSCPTGSPCPTSSPSPSRSASPSPSRTASPTPTVRPPTTGPPPPTGAFSAQYQTIRTTGTTFRGKLTVVNRGSTASPWRVVLDFPAGVQVTGVSGGTFSQSGTRATFDWPSTAPGGTISMEFDATKSQSQFAPLSCTVNGAAC